MSQYAPPWDRAEDAVLASHIYKMSYEDLKLLLPDRTVGAIKRHAFLIGVQRSHAFQHGAFRLPRRTLNDAFFSIPTLQSSYWAGFLAADGCIVTSPRHEVRLGIHKRDIGHLRLLCAEAGFNGKIRIDKKDCAHIIICAAYQWIDDLNSIFNVTPQKTFTLQPPHLSGENALAYCVGYIDGDGCWATQGSRWTYLMLVVVGTNPLLSWMISTLNVAGADIGTPRLTFRRNCWRLSLSSAKAERVAKLLSSVATPKLERKWRVARHEAMGQEV